MLTNPFCIGRLVCVYRALSGCIGYVPKARSGVGNGMLRYRAKMTQEVGISYQGEVVSISSLCSGDLPDEMRPLG